MSKFEPDIIDRVKELLGGKLPDHEVEHLVDTVRIEYGGDRVYIRQDRSVRIRRAIQQGMSVPEIRRRFQIGYGAVAHHRQMLASDSANQA